MSLGECLRSLARSARTHLPWSRLRWVVAVVVAIVWLIYREQHVTDLEPRCMTETTLLYVLSSVAVSTGLITLGSVWVWTRSVET